MNCTMTSSIGRRVHILMWDRDIRNRDLARYLGVSESTLSKKIHGDRPWTVEEFAGIAAFFQVPIGDLMPQIIPPPRDSE